MFGGRCQVAWECRRWPDVAFRRFQDEVWCMNAVRIDEPESARAGAAPPRKPASEVRKGHRMIRCSRCREPLFFPTGYSAQHRAPVLFCRKCGAQTKLPSKGRWFFRVLAVLIFLAATAFVIFTLLKEDAFAP